MQEIQLLKDIVKAVLDIHCDTELYMLINYVRGHLVHVFKTFGSREPLEELAPERYTVNLKRAHLRTSQFRASGISETVEVMDATIENR